MLHIHPAPPLKEYHSPKIGEWCSYPLKKIIYVEFCVFFFEIYINFGTFSCFVFPLNNMF